MGRAFTQAHVIMSGKFVVAALLLSLSSPCWGQLGWSSPGANCVFHIPSSSDPKACESYDLSLVVAHAGGVNFTKTGTEYYYTLNVCSDVAPSNLPESCKGKAAAPAYQFGANSSSCYVIGELKSLLVVSLHEYSKIAQASQPRSFPFHGCATERVRLARLGLSNFRMQ